MIPIPKPFFAVCVVLAQQRCAWVLLAFFPTLRSLSSSPCPFLSSFWCWVGFGSRVWECGVRVRVRALGFPLSPSLRWEFRVPKSKSRIQDPSPSPKHTLWPLKFTALTATATQQQHHHPLYPPPCAPKLADSGQGEHSAPVSCVCSVVVCCCCISLPVCQTTTTSSQQLPPGCFSLLTALG